MEVQCTQQFALRLGGFLQVLEMKEIEETKPSTSSGKLLHGLGTLSRHVWYLSAHCFRNLTLRGHSSHPGAYICLQLSIS